MKSIGKSGGDNEGITYQTEEKEKVKEFHHYVKDKDGHIEMELWYEENGMWSVHYPRYEGSESVLRPGSCFTRFYTRQIGMLIFAYSVEEFERFEKEFLKFIRNEKA